MVAGSEKLSRKLVVLGEALVGLVPEGDDPLRRSERLRRFTVGAELNVAVAASRLGHSVSWIGRVGDDISGESVLDDLRREGVALEGITVDPHLSTGMLLREKTPLGVARVAYARTGSAGSHLSPDDIDPSFIKAHTMAHVSGITPALSSTARHATEAFLQTAREHHVTAVFDLNYRSKLWPADVAGPVLATIAELADIVIGGAEEWQLAFGTDDLSEVKLPKGTSLVRTNGSHPVVARVGGDMMTAQTLPATVVDVVGAGDAFVGGLLSALLAGSDWTTALKQGTYCGARVVSALGDWSNLPWGSGGLVDIPQNDQEVSR